MEHAKAGRPARMIIKNNAVADPGMIKILYRASQAGVPIDMIVRGVCCLRPGIPGISDRINVRSIVGQFLEHSRIYYFENGGAPEVYIGSADLMERNLDRRVEVLCPVNDPAMRQQLRDAVLEVLLSDTDRAWTLRTDGTYVRADRPGRRAAAQLAALPARVVRGAARSVVRESGIRDQVGQASLPAEQFQRQHGTRCRPTPPGCRPAAAPRRSRVRR